MSHGPERHENNCLNCGTTIVGRFCHVCGQENLEPKETAWHLVSHFFNDITHFDGKFFTTLKDLLVRPGFLPREYMLGKRASYLNPVRMYVFTSAIFFLLFFSFFQKEEDFSAKINGKKLEEINAMDSTAFADFTASMNSTGKPMTHREFDSSLRKTFSSGFQISGFDFNSREEYDSLVKAGKRHDGWIARQFIFKQIAINQKYHHNGGEVLSALMHSLLHSAGQMLFVSLPLIALILKLLYVRRRKQFYYVSHGIFVIHFFVFLFLALLVLFSLSALRTQFHLNWLSNISGLLIFWVFLYEYLAMKNFYKQGWIKTFFKFFLLNILFAIVLGILFGVFLFFSFFKI